MNNKSTNMAYNSFQGIRKKLMFIISGILLFILLDQSSAIAQKEMFRYIQLPDPVEDSIPDITKFSDSSGVIEFSQETLQLADVSQFLWACWLPNKDLETKNPTGNSLFLYVRNVESMQTGIYLYIAEEHKLEKYALDVNPDFLVEQVPQYALLKEAAITIIPFSRKDSKIGRLFWKETQHAAMWQSAKLGFANSCITANHPNELISAFALPDYEFPLGLIFIGKK